MKYIIPFLVLLSACAHHRNIIPDAKDVEVRREAPEARKCKLVGDVSGRTASVTGTREDALEDLKKDAINRGGNYVQLGEWSAYGTGVTGTAYSCP